MFFLLLYSYITTTTRKDGYDVYMYEFSTVSCLLCGWFDWDLIDVLDYGDFSRHGRKRLPWDQHLRMDRMGLVRHFDWCHFDLGVHCKDSRFVQFLHLCLTQLLSRLFTL